MFVSTIQSLDVMPGEQDLSLGLQKDLDGAAGMVAQLHGRLAGASCWTKRLLDERNSTIEEVARLRAQVCAYTCGTKSHEYNVSFRGCRFVFT